MTGRMAPEVRAIGVRAKFSVILRWHRAHAFDPASKRPGFGAARAAAKPKPPTRSTPRTNIHRLVYTARRKLGSSFKNRVVARTVSLPRRQSRRRLSMTGNCFTNKRRDESRRGRHECPRHAGQYWHFQIDPLLKIQAGAYLDDAVAR